MVTTVSLSSAAVLVTGLPVETLECMAITVHYMIQNGYSSTISLHQCNK